MKITTKIKNNSTTWNANLRPRVGDVVDLQGNFFQNVSGINSDPNLGVDWLFTGSTITLNQGNLKIISKGVFNFFPNIQVGDIVCGMLDDNITFIPFGKYLGDNNLGGIQNVLNYTTDPLEF